MKFNFINKAKQVVNHEGVPAFTLTKELELYTAVATSGLTDQFYEKESDKLQRIIQLIAKKDAAFVAKLSVYVREQMCLRSIPLVLTVELAKLHRGDDLVRKLTSRVVQRADEITELLAYYAVANQRNDVKQLNKLSKQLQNGLADAFNKFDAYQFAKYNRDATVKLRDGLFQVHPKAKCDRLHAPAFVLRSQRRPHVFQQHGVCADEPMDD